MAPQINWDLLNAVHPDSTVAGTRAGASLQDLKELYTGLKQLGLQYAYTPDVPPQVLQETQNLLITLSVYIKLEERLRFQIKPLDSKGKL